MNKFNFRFYANIFFGSGVRYKINDIISDNNYKNICIVIDHALLSVDLISEFIESINCNKIIVECDISEPTYDKLEDKRIFPEDSILDAFVGIGGGSALDMAKGLSVLYTNLDSAIKYRGFEKFNSNILPIIALPTTAGTGSEITPNASFIDLKEKKKMGINGESIRPKFSILDPELTLSCPIKPSISAGVDSLVHATEAFVAKKTNVMAQMFAKQGFKLVIENLPKLKDDLNNILVRESIMYGAFLSAIALMNSGTGPAAAMSYPLGVHYKVPHGIGGAIFLPHVIEYNISKGFYSYTSLYRNNLFDSKNDIKNAASFIDFIFNIWNQLNIPNEISIFGVYQKNIEEFVKDTMDLKLALDQNPITFYEDEIQMILNKLVIK